MPFYYFYCRQDALEYPIIVKDGFSWWAFLMTVIWLAYKRMWFLASIILCTNVALHIAISTHYTIFLDIFVMMVLGGIGNNLYMMKLRQYNHALIEIVYARNETKAHVKYLEGQDINVPLYTNFTTLCGQFVWKT